MKALCLGLLDAACAVLAVLAMLGAWWLIEAAVRAINY